MLYPQSPTAPTHPGRVDPWPSGPDCQFLSEQIPKRLGTITGKTLMDWESLKSRKGPDPNFPTNTGTTAAIPIPLHGMHISRRISSFATQFA